jgi:cell division protein FtsB
MVSQRRSRNIVLALGFYALAGSAVAYFTYHAQHGDRGLKAKAGYKIRIAQLQAELDQVKQDRADWERRVALLKAGSLDRDLLDERARELLNYAHRNDVVVIVPTTR